MEIFVTLFSILSITILVWLLNRILPFKICPICTGVSLTWLWIVVGMTAGVLEAESWKLIAAIAMGGTAVGIAYQGERRYPRLASNIFQWRLPVILAGFLFVWWALENIGWVSLAVELLILSLLFYFYFLKRSETTSQKDDLKVKELEKKLEEECCD